MVFFRLHNKLAALSVASFNVSAWNTGPMINEPIAIRLRHYFVTTKR